MEFESIRAYVKAFDYAATGSFAELLKITLTVVLSLKWLLDIMTKDNLK